jgi:hypothetical protein
VFSLNPESFDVDLDWRPAMIRTNVRACLVLLVFLLACLLATPLFADQGDAPARVARLSVIKGSVSLQPSGENQWGQASLNYTVTTGDRIYTDQGSRAELEVGPSAVRLSETIDLTMANLNDQLMQLGLGQGTIRVSVYQLPSGNTVEIDTPNGALTVLGPGSYRVDTDPNSGYTLVSVNRGSLQVSGGGTDQTVGTGQAVQLTGTGPVQVAFVSLPAPDDFDQWSMQRDRRIESSAAARYVSRYVPGYDDLDDYGRWEAVAEYGPVWYPGAIPPGWVPYRFGYWAWVEPWGWTWVEAEPWGFCPFHYGRWAFIAGAWGWVPGPVALVPVYSPALVAFVGGSGFSFSFSFGGLGVAAWFPLGPGEPFVPWYHYSPGYLRQVNITNVRNVTNITNITNITNVNNLTYVNRNVATTAVPATVFRSGQSVASQAVHVSPEQIARAQVIAHPSFTPTPQVATGGKPVPAPQIRAPRIAPPPQMARRQPSPLTSGRPSQQQPPLVTRNVPPSGPTGGRPAPPPTRPTTPYPSPAQHAPGGPPSAPSRVITKTPLPPSYVPFEKRQPAMQEHPGRPLEPQQIENLRTGKPPGPMRDREVAPHAQASPNKPSQTTSSGSKPAPRSRPQP